MWLHLSVHDILERGASLPLGIVVGQCFSKKKLDLKNLSLVCSSLLSTVVVTKVSLSKRYQSKFLSRMFMASRSIIKLVNAFI